MSSLGLLKRILYHICIYLKSEMLYFFSTLLKNSRITVEAKSRILSDLLSRQACFEKEVGAPDECS